MTQAYDDTGRLETHVYPSGGSGSALETDDYAYDGRDRAVELIGPRVTYRHTYTDALGGNRTSVMTLPAPSSASYSVSITTNDDLSLASVAYPGGGETLTHVRTTSGRLLSISDSSSAPVVDQVAYDLVGRPRFQRMGGVLERTDVYDRRRNLVHRMYRTATISTTSSKDARAASLATRRRTPKENFSRGS
ncbi:MAG: hypothetical protein AAF449_11950 [Myxococcota bacterium]